MAQIPIGIDLGTTHSLIATVEKGLARVLRTHEGFDLLPSVVSLQGDTLKAVGYAAKQNQIADGETSQSFASVKRLMGRSSDQLPIEISSILLRALKESAETQLGKTVREAVITVPAYFDDAQRQATRTAARLAGLLPVRILNEPTAAALAYGVDTKRNGRFAVFDLGGGTFDVSILSIQDGMFEVLSTCGDTELGGNDLDMALLKALGIELSSGPSDANDAKARAAAEAVRKAFSDPELIATKFELIASDGTSLNRLVSRADHDAALIPVLERTLRICGQALSDAGLSADQLDDVLLVGGTTRMPLVRQIAEKAFGRTPNSSLDPDRVVALGAAIQADILAGNRPDMLLMDIVPLTLGMETYGGIFHPLIHRNSKLPTLATEAFTTYADRQTGVDIHILQGERDLVAENRSLGRFVLKGIAPQQAGKPRIEVTFLIDADGILQVSAKDLASGKSQSIEVQPASGLTESKIEEMLHASLENARVDATTRQDIERTQKLDQLVHQVEKHMGAAKTFWEERKLPDASWDELQAALKDAKACLGTRQLDVVEPTTERLSKASHRLAELLVYDGLKR